MVIQLDSKEFIFLQKDGLKEFSRNLSLTINEHIDCIVLIWSYSPTSFPTIKQSNRAKGQSKPNRKEDDEAYRVLLLAVHMHRFRICPCFKKNSLSLFSFLVILFNPGRGQFLYLRNPIQEN